jgi:hypothetical protein
MTQVFSRFKYGLLIFKRCRQKTASRGALQRERAERGGLKPFTLVCGKPPVS